MVSEISETSGGLKWFRKFLKPTKDENGVGNFWNQRWFKMVSEIFLNPTVDENGFGIFLNQRWMKIVSEISEINGGWKWFRKFLKPMVNENGFGNFWNQRWMKMVSEISETKVDENGFDMKVSETNSVTRMVAWTKTVYRAPRLEFWAEDTASNNTYTTIIFKVWNCESLQLK